MVANGAFSALVECKTGNRKRTAGQEKFAKEWGGIVIEARTPEEAEGKILAAWQKTYAWRPAPLWLVCPCGWAGAPGTHPATGCSFGPMVESNG